MARLGTQFPPHSSPRFLGYHLVSHRHDHGHYGHAHDHAHAHAHHDDELHRYSYYI